jgi:hypothetical protein
MTRAELVAIVARLYTGEDSDKKATKLVDRLEEELPHSNISDLIFHDFRGLTPEQVVDEAMLLEAEHRARSAKS